jgi:hypothetical protein
MITEGTQREAGRLHSACIERKAGKASDYLKGVYNSTGVKVEVPCTQWKLANDDQQSLPALKSIVANSPWRVTFPNLN